MIKMMMMTTMKSRLAGIKKYQRKKKTNIRMVMLKLKRRMKLRTRTKRKTKMTQLPVAKRKLKRMMHPTKKIKISQTVKVEISLSRESTLNYFVFTAGVNV